MLILYKFYKSFFIVALFSILLFSCGGGSSDEDPYTPPPEETVNTPSNLTLSITIEGEDVSNPNGNGTGTIHCIASATDAVSYGFRFGDGSEYNSTGSMDFTYSNNGINAYTVYVYAYSSTGHSVSTSKEIIVFVAPNDSFSTLIWSDEFDTDGSPDSSKWGYDIGTGQGGWGNNESQYYTSRSDNVIIEGGLLKIIAKKENYSGAEYTSTRMLTMGKFDFTYGRVEVRAKLPLGDGTWPAIWALGANFQSVGWPACGEIDIMEHAGIRQGTVSSAMHTPSSYGGTVNHGDQYIADVSTAFHVYALEWNNEEMVFTVDDVEHYRYNPSTKNSDTWPYDTPQFLILNVAMGGTFGGTIDPNFVSSTMEIDYVRVYQ